MIVLVTLFRMKADETREEEYEPLINELRAPLRDLETKIWRIAARVLSEEQGDELRALIVQWYEDHPDVRYVDTIRFEDWAAGRGVKQAVRKRSSLLFNAVGDISEQVDQAMLAADRLTYLLQRMPTLARWQAELVYNEVAASPTAQRVLAHTETVSSAVDRVSTTIDGLPDRIDEMRRDTLREAGNIRDETIRQLDASLAKYQEQFWRDLDERSEMIKSVSADVRATMGEADKLTQSIDKVVVSTQTLTVEVRETFGRIVICSTSPSSQFTVLRSRSRFENASISSFVAKFESPKTTRRGSRAGSTASTRGRPTTARETGPARSSSSWVARPVFIHSSRSRSAQALALVRTRGASPSCSGSGTTLRTMEKTVRESCAPMG